jgi:hypothetical protein
MFPTGTPFPNFIFLSLFLKKFVHAQHNQAKVDEIHELLSMGYTAEYGLAVAQ